MVLLPPAENPKEISAIRMDPCDFKGHAHTYGYAYGTESGATRRPRVLFPKSTSRKPSNPGGLKRKGGPKHVGEQVEVTAFRA